MTGSKIFLYFCLSFIGGIFLNSFLKIPQLLMLSFLILGIFLISLFWEKKKLVIIGLSLLFFLLGIWRFQAAELNTTTNELKQYNDREEKISFIGQVVREPDIRDTNLKLIIKPEKIDGKILLTTSRYPEYQYGDKLEIKGFLKTPQEFPDFNYQDYLAKDGIYSVIYWPEIKLVGRNQGNLFYAYLLNFKNKLRKVVYQNLSPPQSSILGAVILGDKRQISEKWKEKLNITGLRHITCVSGMHIVILSEILIWLGIALGLWRQKAFYFALILLTLFIIMIGAPPSAIRAGIMGGLLLFAQKVGRLRSSGRTIVFAATAMLVQNPLLLRSDVGFQLSFLATLGIIYLMPSFQYYFRKISNSKVFPLRNLLAMTLSAQVFTLPILIYNFGYMSLIAPITNILTVPLLPFVMVGGFLFVLAGMIWQPLGWIFSWLNWLLLTYLTKMIDFFSRLPWASLSLKVSWVWIIIFYLILVLVTWRLNQKLKLKFLDY